MMSDQEMREILVDARQRIEDEGWVRCVFFSDHFERYGYCALGSVAMSIGEEFFSELLRSEGAFHKDRVKYAQIATFLSQFVPDADSCIPLWNDRPGRTKEEVLDLFEQAITHLDERLAPAQERELVLA